MIKHWSEFLDWQRERAGGLRDHFPTFVAALAGRGYAKTTASSRFGWWLSWAAGSSGEICSLATWTSRNAVNFSATGSGRGV
jgi:hypothetical protein